MWLRLARRNLLHDRRRFAASVAGVCFSVDLVIVQLALFAGLAANASQVIDRSPGDVWVSARNTSNFQWGRPIPLRALDVVRGTPGVAWASELVVGWTQVRVPEGGMQQLEVIGFDAAYGVGAPWNVVAGNLADLAIPQRIVLDRGSMEKLGAFALGDYRETLNERLRIAAITSGISSFTTVPFAFTSADTARRLTGYMGPDDTVYVVAGLRPGADPAATFESLRRRLPDLDVDSRDDMSTRTRRYWMFETGMGIGFLLTSLLAIGVGTVIVSQNIYAITLEHLAEYATLEAMGIAMRSLAAVVMGQALLTGVAGAIPGCLLGAAVVDAIQSRGLPAALSTELVAATLLAALATCVLASVTSIRRVTRLEPALVFRT
jgi:putative ABC transport system permease protein